MSATGKAPNPAKAVDSPRSVQPAAEYVRLDALKPWKDNPRDNAEAIKEVARSIRRFGFGSPIVARRANGEIIAGHTRFLAAKRLRLAEVPVRYLDIDEREAHALALADNKLGEIADWNDEALAKILAEFQADDVDLDFGTGFSDREIENLVGDQGEDEDDGRPEGTRTGRALGGLTFRIIIDCKDEADQAQILDWLDKKGISCRPLMS